MTHLLDTDHLSILQRPTSRERNAVVANINLHDPANVCACVVSFHEQVMGCHNRVRRAHTPDALIEAYEFFSRVIRDYTQFSVLPFDRRAVDEWLKLKAQKVRVKPMDLRIAAIALANKLTVVTRNIADFSKVPNLKIADWTK
jgi:tRNA(fMet)-specific endonuclease VapC